MHILLYKLVVLLSLFSCMLSLLQILLHCMRPWLVQRVYRLLTLLRILHTSLPLLPRVRHREVTHLPLVLWLLSFLPPIRFQKRFKRQKMGWILIQLTKKFLLFNMGLCILRVTTLRPTILDVSIAIPTVPIGRSTSAMYNYIQDEVIKQKLDFRRARRYNLNPCIYHSNRGHEPGNRDIRHISKKMSTSQDFIFPAVR